MFHEFGHALHGMFSNVKYPTLAGTNVPRDFVEFPSQFNEHWALEPTVFAHYAKHYKTGEPMPQELVETIKKAGTFNQGFATERVPRGRPARHGLAHAAGRAPSSRTSTSSRPAALKRYHVDYSADPAALPLELLRPHLGRRLFGRLLRLHVERGAATTTPTTGSRSTAA